MHECKDRWFKSSPKGKTTFTLFFLVKDLNKISFKGFIKKKLLIKYVKKSIGFKVKRLEKHVSSFFFFKWKDLR